MSNSRITGDDTSRISITIGIIVALIAVFIASYFIFVGWAKAKEITGFDPNRPLPTNEVLRKRLKPEQYRVTRENGTETPFQNDYWNNVRTGLYVDIITGEPLFTSAAKWDNSTGQLTFTQPISYDLLVEKQDLSYNMIRTEVRAKRSDSHLGHVFGDPKSPTGRRYSVNSAAFRFIPVDFLEKQGYEQYRSLFDQKK
jgi:methionine-R-sulfoxide reductase